MMETRVFMIAAKATVPTYLTWQILRASKSSAVPSASVSELK